MEVKDARKYGERVANNWRAVRQRYVMSAYLLNVFMDTWKWVGNIRDVWAGDMNICVRLYANRAVLFA